LVYKLTIPSVLLVFIIILTISKYYSLWRSQNEHKARSVCKCLATPLPFLLKISYYNSPTISGPPIMRMCLAPQEKITILNDKKKPAVPKILKIL